MTIWHYVARATIKRMVKNNIDVTKATVGTGITFKENCPDIRNSKIVDVIKEFDQWGIKVAVCDPLGQMPKKLNMNTELTWFRWMLNTPWTV